MKQRGFTLIELMIVIAIIGILASIAVPSYRDYVRKANMAEVIAIVEAQATKLQVYYNENGFWPTEGDWRNIEGITRTSFSSDVIEQTWFGRVAQRAQLAVLPRATAFGTRQWIRYYLDDQNGIIGGTWCDAQYPTHVDLQEYTPEGAC
ncbi:MAG: prepilin-type N-terminal cleavage/methylation domain-containing protein [Pseudomonadota bacterium]